MQTTKPDSSVPMQLTLKSDEQERQKVHVEAQFAKKRMDVFFILTYFVAL